MKVKDWNPERVSIPYLETIIPKLYFEYKNLVTPSEVPNEFHVFGFMNMISAFIGDKIYFNEGGDTIYPNLWTLFLAPSGLGRKSTSINPIAKILSKTNVVNFLPSKGSPEGFFKALEKHKGIGFRRDTELGALLGALKRNYQQGFADEFCELYDTLPSPLKKRLSHSTIEIPQLAITWLAATTPESLSKCCGAEQIAVGFLPRWNIVFGSESSTKISFRYQRFEDSFNNFARKLAKLYPKTKTQYTFSEASKKVYHKWYIKHHHYRGRLGKFAVRIREVAKRYAVLFAFLDGRQKVYSRDIISGCEFSRYFIYSATRLLNTELSESQFDANCKRVKEAIKKLKSSTNRNLMRTTHLNKKDFLLCIDTLYASGEIGQYENDTWFIDKEIVDEY